MSQQVKVYGSLTLETGGSGSSARILAGASTTPSSYTAGTPAVAMYFTNAGTSGSTNAEPFYVKSTIAGAGQVGGRSRFDAYTNVTAGGWVNAVKAYMEFGTSGRTTGLASSLVAEMVLPSTDITAAGGGYFPLEVEYVAGGNALTTAGALTGNHAGFIWLQQSGDADGDFDDNGYLMHIKGMTAGSGHLFATGGNTGTIAGSLKIGVDNTAYYIPLWSSEVAT